MKPTYGLIDRLTDLSPYLGLFVLAFAAGPSGAQTLSKEYIRLGGQVIAIENSVANVTVSPSSLTFSQAVGTTSSAQTVTASNGGNAAAAISVGAVSGANAADFSAANTCGTSLAAGASCTVSVTFTPGGAGTRTANLLITAAGNNYTVTLTGTGTTTPGISFNPPSLTFAAASGVFAPQTETVSSSGSAPLLISNPIVVTGANAGNSA